MEIQAVAVVGSGVIGRTVAQALGETGHDVVLIDRSQAQLESALGDIARSSRLHGMLRRDREHPLSDDVLARVETSTEIRAAAEADFVVENVTEDWDAKRRVHAELDDACRPRAVIAVNTSALPITRVASVGRRPERVVGLHFMNPVPLMPMVEVIPGLRTSDETLAAAKLLVAQLGKECIVVRDSPGFVTNRVMMQMVNEACFLVDEGVASAPDVDRLFKTCFGHKMGPLETADLIGVDTVLRSLEVIHDAFGDSKYRPSQLMCRMVEAGLLGRKSGQGFYRYSSPRAAAPAPPGLG